MRTSVRPVGLLLVTAALLQACDSAGPPAMPRTLADSAGTVVSTNVEGQWQGGDGWSVAMQPRVQIGVVEGDEEYELHDVVAAALQSDGDFVLADAGAHAVRLYDPSGTLKRTLGTAGPAPGEFRRPSHILVGSADSVFVWDDAAWRLTKFDAEGAFAGVESLRLEEISKAVEPPLYPQSAMLISGGAVLIRLVEKTKDTPLSGRFRSRSGALRVSADRTVVEPFVFFPGGEEVSVESPWGPLPMVPPFAKSTSITVQPDEPRVCVGDQEGAEVRCFEVGRPAMTVRWQADPIPVDGNERAITEWREAALELYGQKLSPDDVRRLIDRVPLPEVRPEYGGLVLDRTGHLWVERGPTPSSGPDAKVFLVFNRAGELLGAVATPAVRVLEIGTDYLLGVREDEFGVQFLGLYDVRRPKDL